eukprot:g68296.t1
MRRINAYYSFLLNLNRSVWLCGGKLEYCKYTLQPSIAIPPQLRRVPKSYTTVLQSSSMATVAAPSYPASDRPAACIRKRCACSLWLLPLLMLSRLASTKDRTLDR